MHRDNSHHGRLTVYYVYLYMYVRAIYVSALRCASCPALVRTRVQAATPLSS